MTTLTRKNLVIDDAKLKRLAHQRGKSESATVRELIDFALLADEVGEIFHELQKRGGIDDAFGRLTAVQLQDAAPRQPQAVRRAASRTKPSAKAS
jgi:predicted nucleic acid-binding protein